MSAEQRSRVRVVESGEKFHTTNRIVSYKPKRPERILVPGTSPEKIDRQKLLHYTEIDSTDLPEYFTDRSNLKLGGTERVIRFNSNATTDDIAEVVRITDKILPVGARSAITGAASPDNEVVLDMSQRVGYEIGEDKKTVTVQTGLTIQALQESLAEEGLYYPPAPTYDGATIGGTINTNAAGAATFKYGQTRPWVDAIKVVLPNGDVMDIERGKYMAQNGEFIWVDSEKGEHKITVPTYTMPDVPKISAGYYAKPAMDLIDLFIGAEGTLGVITEARLRVIEKPEVMWSLISCESEQQALRLTKRLRNLSIKARERNTAEGLDVSAIEYIDGPSVNLLRIDHEKLDEESKRQKPIDPPKDAKTLLLVQMEMNKDAEIAEKQFTRFGKILGEFGLQDATEPADKSNQKRIDYFIRMREGVPDGVNSRIKKQKENDPGISKTAGDMIVPFEDLPAMMQLFRENFSQEYVLYIWGHVSDGNMHVNIVPKSTAQTLSAREILKKCAKWVIKQGGSPLSEHGVGKLKQQFLVALYGEEGVEEMRKVKDAFDPTNKMPQNIFALAA